MTGVCSYCNVGQHADCTDFDCRCDYKPDNGHGAQKPYAASQPVAEEGE